MDSRSLLIFVAASVLPSLIVALLGTYVVRRNAEGWGLLDLPSERKVHTMPTPRGGGLAVWFGVVGIFAVGQLALWYAMRASGTENLAPEFARSHLPGIWAQS